MHVPVFRGQVVDYLCPRREGGLIVDGTVGEGGHAEVFLARDPTLRLVGVDADPEILRIASGRLAAYGDRCRLVHARFAAFFAAYGTHCGGPADAVLLDLGVSMYHFRSSGRGFSFSSDEPLDMRLDPEQESSAADLLNTLPEEELADLFFRYGEERMSRRIARAIAGSRAGRHLESSRELAELVRRAIGRSRQGHRIHPATRVFQALRIAVNDELGEIERGLPAALEALAPGGRIGVISFHSLEDRLVKGILRTASAAGEAPPKFRLVEKKPLVPEHEEILANPAARSAKLRIAERLEEPGGRSPDEGAA